MDIQRLLTSLSLKILIQFAIAVIAITALIIWNLDFLNRFYLQNQQTQTGIIINSVIAGLLVSGLISIVIHLIRYKKEEQAIVLFVNNIESLRPDLTHGIPSSSMIVNPFCQKFFHCRVSVR